MPPNRRQGKCLRNVCDVCHISKGNSNKSQLYSKVGQKGRTITMDTTPGVVPWDLSLGFCHEIRHNAQILDVPHVRFVCTGVLPCVSLRFWLLSGLGKIFSVPSPAKNRAALNSRNKHNGRRDRSGTAR